MSVDLYYKKKTDGLEKRAKERMERFNDKVPKLMNQCK